MRQSLYLACLWVVAVGLFLLGLAQYAKFLAAAAGPQIGWSPLLAAFLMILGAVIGLASPVLITRNRNQKAQTFRSASESVVAEGDGGAGQEFVVRPQQTHRPRSDGEFS